MATRYTPLLYHSNYGIGGSDFKTLFEHLAKYDLTSCGIIDDTLFGLPEFVTYARRYDIKPIIGTKISLPLPSTGKITLYLFARNSRGYENLCQIITHKAFHKISLPYLKEHADGLVILSTSTEILYEFKSMHARLYHLLLPYHSLLSQEFPPLAAHEIYYASPNDRILHRLMCAIKKRPSPCARGIPEYLLPHEKFRRMFTETPDALKNNYSLPEVCTFIPQHTGWLFPRSKQNLREIIRPRLTALTRTEKDRIRHEHTIIKETGFEPYFVLTYHLKEFARSKGIGINVRGSAASSFILYVLGLSVANPLLHNLPFERFLNPQRSEPPDIDVDVEYNQRDILVNEIFRHFGDEFVARVSVINRFKRRARFRDTARAYGISPRELKTIEHHLNEHLISGVNALGERIHGYPHYFSCHASGIVITPEPISTLVPLYPSPAGPITNFDKDGIELAGLVKIDILGVRGFPALYFKKETISFDNQNVFQIIGKARTLGCFQIESPLVRSFLRRIKPKSITDIANAIAIIRPGPARGGMKEKFLKRLKGEETIEYPHNTLKLALQDTLGIPIYQEQILQMAHDFACFSLSDGDMLRRAMTKERNINRMKELQELFFRKAQDIGHKKQEIEKVWKRISSFSSFGFNKAHAITYGTLAYLSAYQKCHDPLAFFCRLINAKGGYYTTYAYVNEARRWGLSLHPPDVNKSEAHFSIQKSALITGLGEIKNLSSPTIERIVRHRPFKSAEDFFHYAKPSIDEGTALIKSGALDTFGYTWPALYFLLLLSRAIKAHPPSVKECVPQFHDFSTINKFCEQFHTIDFLPHCHILEILCPERTTKIIQVTKGKQLLVTGTPIVRTIIRTKHDQRMAFVTIDDETGVLEVVFFPRAYRPHCMGPIMHIHGAVKDDIFVADDCTPAVIESR